MPRAFLPVQELLVYVWHWTMPEPDGVYQAICTGHSHTSLQRHRQGLTVVLCRTVSIIGVICSGKSIAACHAVQGMGANQPISCQTCHNLSVEDMKHRVCVFEQYIRLPLLTLIIPSQLVRFSVNILSDFAARMSHCSAGALQKELS